MVTNFLKFLAFLFFVVIAVSILVLGSTDLTARETGFLGILLAIFSTVVGGIITHIYAEAARIEAIKELSESHQKSLRVYALKAAEKVTNLSKELGRMAAYLEEELQENDYGSPQEELSAKEERIYSAIHLVNTLKSVNDTALSDWQGVIGTELDEQRVQAVQREELLRDVTDRLATLETARKQEIAPGTIEEARIIHSQIETLRRDIGVLAGALGAPLPPVRRPSLSARVISDSICPQCEAPKQWGQSYFHDPHFIGRNRLRPPSFLPLLLLIEFEYAFINYRLREHVVCVL